MDMKSKSKAGSIVLLIFLLICSGLGVSAFVMSLTKCKPCKVENMAGAEAAATDAAKSLAKKAKAAAAAAKAKAAAAAAKAAARKVV